MTQDSEIAADISARLLPSDDAVELFSPSTTVLQKKINEIPIPVMAYVGDAVFEVFARLNSLKTSEWKMNTLHRASVRLVKAESQAELLRLLEPHLSEVEKDIVRRGRNAKSGQVPRSVSAVLYRYSTAFETLVGYLYLTNRHRRIEELFSLIGLSDSSV